MTTEDVLPVWLRRLELEVYGSDSNIWIQARGRPDSRLARPTAGQVRSRPRNSSRRARACRFRYRLDASVSGGDRSGREWCASDVPQADNGLVRTLPSHVLWHRSAERLLGIGRAETVPLPDYIAVSFRGGGKRGGIARAEIEDSSAVHWLRALARRGTYRNTSSTAGSSWMSWPTSRRASADSVVLLPLLLGTVPC